ncbi:hypothetical protein PSY19_24055, partial [Shigella flexneri]|nr:hypothetical protein [Shigella flexneri]
VQNTEETCPHFFPPHLRESGGYRSNLSSISIFSGDETEAQRDQSDKISRDRIELNWGGKEVHK